MNCKNNQGVITRKYGWGKVVDIYQHPDGKWYYKIQLSDWRGAVYGLSDDDIAESKFVKRPPIKNMFVS